MLRKSIFVVIVVIAATLPGWFGPAWAKALSERDKLWTQNALKAIDTSNWTMARKYMKRVKHPLASKILIWTFLSRPGLSVDFDWAARFITENPDWPRQIRLRRRAEEALKPDHDPSEVVSWFERLPPLSGDGMARYGAALIKTGKSDEGRKWIRRAWTEGNFTKSRERTLYKQFRKLLTREDHHKRLERLLWEGKNWPVRRMMWKVNPKLRALAEARTSLRRRTGNVDRLIEKVPPEFKNDPGLIYERLRWRRINNKDSAFAIVLNPPPDMVRPDLWWKERAVLARRALKKGHVSDAYRISSEHGLVAGAEYADAEWLSGWIALRFLKDAKTAMMHFTNMYSSVRYPISLARGAYWSSQAAEAMGDGEAAAHWGAIASEFRTTYYGQLAAAARRPGEGLRLPEEPEVNGDSAQEFNGQELVAVIRLLAGIDEQSRLKPFVMKLSEISDERGWKSLAAKLARQNGRRDLSVRIAKAASRAGIRMLQSGYPLINLPAMSKKAQAKRPETPLTLAVIRQESAFQENARSHAKAQGLMQLMPATAKKMSRALKLRYSRRKLTNDPVYNLTLGQAYLGRVIDRYDGSYVLALAAYNAGPARVNQWLRRNGDPRGSEVDAIDWVELIPISETRNYVQRVLENLQVYRMRLAKTEIALSLDSDLHN